MGDTVIRLDTSYIRTAAIFEEPILSWTSEIPARLFRALYSSLNEILFIQPNDFFAPSGVSLGDCSAGLRIFGSTSTLTLKANAVITDFPNVPADRVQFATTVIYQGYEAFLGEFREVKIRSIEAIASSHFEIHGDKRIEDIVGAGGLSNLHERGSILDEVVYEPGLRFRVVSKSGDWNCKVMVEKSDILQGGLFMHREFLLSDLSAYGEPRQQLDMIQQVDRMIFELMGLSIGE